MENYETETYADTTFAQAERALCSLFPPEKYGEDPDVCLIYDSLTILKDLANKPDRETMELILDKLFEEIKHGDGEHQLWLKNKIADYLKTFPE